MTNKTPLSKIIKLLLAGIFLLMYYMIFNEGSQTTSLNTIIIILFTTYLLFFTYSQYGLYSAPFLLSVFYLYPLLTPFYSFYISDVGYFKMFNKDLQDDVSLINKAQLYYFLSALIMIITIHFSIRSKKQIIKKIKNKRFIPIGSSWSLLFSSLSLAMAYLSDPGGTIFTHTYSEVLQSRIAGTEFASGLFVVFWVISFINYQQGKQKKFFLVVTILSIFWLVLHAKRAPLLGISFAVLFYLQAFNKIKPKHMLLSFLLVLSLFTVGEVRNSLSTSTVVFSSQQEDIAALPGNGAGVFLTIMGAIHISDNVLKEYLLGESYLNEIYGVIPSPILRLLDLPIPLGYGNSVYSNHLYYQGGMHLLSPAYANFGIAGIVLISIIIGLIIAYIHNAIASESLDKRAHAYMLVLFFPAAIWYNFMIYLSWTIYFFSLLIILRLIIVPAKN